MNFTSYLRLWIFVLSLKIVWKRKLDITIVIFMSSVIKISFQRRYPNFNFWLKYLFNYFRSLHKMKENPSAFHCPSWLHVIPFTLGDILRNKKGFVMNVNHFSSYYGRQFHISSLNKMQFQEKLKWMTSLRRSEGGKRSLRLEEN